MKIKVTTDSGTSYMATVDRNARLSPHFKLAELANNMGDSSIQQWVDTPESRLFVVMLEELRVWFDLPMVITSCYRQPAWNAHVGGNRRSAHLYATAADWHIKHTDRQRENVRRKWCDICAKHGVIGAINYYTTGYHLEAFSDRYYGSKSFAVRDYRGTARDWR